MFFCATLWVLITLAININHIYNYKQWAVSSHTSLLPKRQELFIQPIINSWPSHYIYCVPLSQMSRLNTRHGTCHSRYVQSLVSWSPNRLMKHQISISHIDYLSMHAFLQSHSIKGPRDITPVTQEGQIISWSSKSYYMISSHTQRLFYHPVTEWLDLASKCMTHIQWTSRSQVLRTIHIMTTWEILMTLIWHST